MKFLRSLFPAKSDKLDEKRLIIASSMCLNLAKQKIAGIILDDDYQVLVNKTFLPLFSLKSDKIDENTLARIADRYHTSTKNKEKGIMTDDDYQIELLKIINSLFSLHGMDDLEKDNNERIAAFKDNFKRAKDEFLRKNQSSTEGEVNIQNHLAELLNQDSIPVVVFLQQNRYDRLKAFQRKDLIDRAIFEVGLRKLRISFDYLDTNDVYLTEVISKDKSALFLGDIKERIHLLLDTNVGHKKRIKEVKKIQDEYDQLAESFRIGEITGVYYQIALNRLDIRLAELTLLLFK